jgi:hypothetical protein
MSHVTPEPADALLVLYRAGDSLASSGSSRLARRVDEALRRVVALDEAARSVPDKSPRLVKALDAMRELIE